MNFYDRVMQTWTVACMDAMGKVLPINYIDYDTDAKEVEVGHSSETPIAMKDKTGKDVHCFIISYKVRAKDEEHVIN